MTLSSAGDPRSIAAASNPVQTDRYSIGRRSRSDEQQIRSLPVLF